MGTKEARQGAPGHEGALANVLRGRNLPEIATGIGYVER
jgi:hypothetical protein